MKKPSILHPVLFAVFPFLFFYAHNIQDIHALTLAQVLVLAGLVLGITFTAWLLFRLLFGEYRKSALATSVLVLIVFTYGHFYTLLEGWDVFVTGHVYLFALLLLGFGSLVYLLRKTSRDFGNATKFLNVAASVLVAINLFTIINYEVPMRSAQVPETDLEAMLPDDIEDVPDIYLIILDEYGHNDTLKEYFNYNNEKFITRLEERGFFVAHESTMHNEKSVRAIASILNMEHISESEPERISHQRIEDNKVVEYLRTVGYEYIYFGHWYEIGRYQVDADRYFNYYESDHGLFSEELIRALVDTTILKPFYKQSDGDEGACYHQDGLTGTFNHLSEIPSAQSPKFVYAHLMTPHAPFVFGSDGDCVDPEDHYNVEYYTGQLKWTNKQVESVIDSILENSETEPVIILQSDHGPRWTSEWHKILNAYYLPGDNEELVHDSISPVDTFRVILNHYLGADF